MKKLNCFASGFSFAPSRVIFQNGGETPTQAPTPKVEKKEQPDLTPEQVKAREQKEAQKRDERLFKELKSKVDELNAQLKKGSEMKDMGLDKDISFQLFDIVKQLNTKLNLGLDNTSLDIHSEKGNLVITFSTDTIRYTNEFKPTYNHSDDPSKGKYMEITPNVTSTKIIINPDLSFEKHIRDNKTGQTKIEKK